MNLYVDVLKWVKEAIVEINPLASELDMSKVNVEPTKDASHGDVSTNAAMVLSKALATNPRELGNLLCQKLQAHNEIESATIAGPGFVNITFKNHFWHQQLNGMIQMGTSFGKPAQDGTPKEPILVEYVSVNPTGPLHAGHGRNAILGDTIASLLAFCGHKVTREYYINDAGGQVDALSRSAYVRYCECFGKVVTPADFGPDMYGGDYLVPAGQELAKRYSDKFVNADESEWLEIFKDDCVALMMDMIKTDLTKAGIMMDVYTSEKALAKAGLIDQMLEHLTQTGDAYVGVLAAPKGIELDDWEEKPQTLFKSQEHGDDVDRVIKKSNGAWTYFAGDSAYHFDKFKRGFTQMINVFGADHAGYLKRLKAVVHAMTQGKANLEIKVTQMVNFMDNGNPIRMSKRLGTFITFRDVVERVGIDATRYMMVSRHQDSALDFDFAAVIAQIKDNPMFYINYAHARIHSVIRHMKNLKSDFDTNNLIEADLSTLTDASEIDLIKVLATFPRQIEMAAHYREPHRIANALYDLATQFHSLWNKGKTNTQLRFIDENDFNKTKAKLALIWQVATVIKTGFGILGIAAIEIMTSQDENETEE